MITGDHSVTARSIAELVGLGGETPRIVEGHELTSYDGKVSEQFLQAEIFARVSPTEKLDLVRSYQAAGEIVAVTGDGVNDAPALRQADIGVAMGLRGTDVAREAAAMILLDDAFPTIVEAIRNGRVIFGNIRRFATYLLSCNLGEISDRRHCDGLWAAIAASSSADPVPESCYRCLSSLCPCHGRG